MEVGASACLWSIQILFRMEPIAAVILVAWLFLGFSLAFPWLQLGDGDGVLMSCFLYSDLGSWYATSLYFVRYLR